MKKVYYLGPVGSFSDVLVKQYYPSGYKLILCASFSEVVQEIKSHVDSIGVLCVENSISSDVHECVDMIYKKDLQILEEAYLMITMHCIGLKTACLLDITDAYSHPQALMQTSNFINRHNLISHTTKSTAEGQLIVIKENDIHKALIGGSTLAKNNMLHVIVYDIGNVKYNMTRFVFVTTDPIRSKTKGNKRTYIIKIKHEPGSLARLLTALSTIKINLTKIESHPIPGTDWEYEFWIDMEVPSENQDRVDTILKTETLEYYLIGIYEKGQKFFS